MSHYSERIVEVPWAFEHIKRLGPQLILEVGNDGSSWGYLNPLMENGWSVCITDIRHVDVPSGWPVEFRKSNAARSIPWPDNTFGLTMAISTIDHIGEPNYGSQGRNDVDKRNAIRDMCRVLKPGGVLLATAPVGKAGVYPWILGQQRVFSPKEWIGLFDLASWDLLEMKFWVLVGDDYKECDQFEAWTAEYQTFRAGACCALALVKKVSHGEEVDQGSDQEAGCAAAVVEGQGGQANPDQEAPSGGEEGGQVGSTGETGADA